ncbi:MAG: transcription antitermination factor NusB [Candidatus Lustribacter sp.]|jgi:16S rRNA (cytosine967-C5)-methyltransferase
MTTAVRPAPSARNVAFAVIRDVFGPQARGAAESLDRHLRNSSLDPRDRAFVTELAYGTIERRRWLDWQLEPYLGARAAKLPQMIAEILRLGTYQLRAMRVHEYAAVSESVQLARRFGHPGTAGLVNAVLRRVAADPERPVNDADFPSPDDVLGTRFSLPTWLVRMWRERFGTERLPAILAGVNGPAAIGLSIDRRRGTREETIARLAEHGIAAAPSPFAADAIVVGGNVPTPALRAALGDRAELHSEAACFPVDLLDPKPGERILESCSGRGNKTLQLASAIGDHGTIVAIDSDARKVARARTRLAAAEIASVELRTGDAGALDGNETFDAILVDAPCSGIGIIGRQPEARWRKSPDDGARLAPQQRALVDAAARALAPGGRLVYAVCSTDPREGEGVIDPFLAAHPELERAPLPARYAPFATPAGDVLVPPGIDGRDGFTIAVVRRR